MAISNGIGTVVAPGLTPMIGVPTPEELLAAAAQWFIDMLTASAASNLANTIKEISTESGPRFDGDWYEYLFGNALSVAVLICGVFLSFTLFVAIWSRNGFTRVFAAGKTAAGAMIYSYLFLIAMGILTILANALTTIPLAIANWAGGDEWQKKLMFPAITDVVDAVWIMVFGKGVSFLLQAEVAISHRMIYIFTFLSIFTFALRNAGVWGDRLWRLNVSLVVACFLMKPVGLLWLSMGVVILRFTGDSGLTAMWIVLLSQLFAAISFIVMMVLANKAYVHVLGTHDSRSKVEGAVDINKLPTQDELRVQIDEHRSASFNPQTYEGYTAIAANGPPQPSVTDMVRQRVRGKVDTAVDAGIVAGATALGASPAVGAAAVGAKHAIQDHRAQKKEGEKA